MSIIYFIKGFNCSFVHLFNYTVKCTHIKIRELFKIITGYGCRYHRYHSLLYLKLCLLSFCRVYYPYMKRKESTSIIYTQWLQSDRAYNSCKCEVGACPFCNLLYKQCMCTWNGIYPLDIFKNSRGGCRRQTIMFATSTSKQKKEKVETGSDNHLILSEQKVHDWQLAKVSNY